MGEVRVRHHRAKYAAAPVGPLAVDPFHAQIPGAQRVDVDRVWAGPSEGCGCGNGYKRRNQNGAMNRPYA